MNNRNDADPSSAATPSQPGQPPVDPGAIQTAPSPGSEGIQAEAPPTVPVRISLPPLSAQERLAEDAARRLRINLLLDWLLVVLVLGLAFLCASFPIRNSDLLMHLGTGKLLSEGKYTLGEDPFSVNSLGARWVNHSWLLDFVGYQLFRTIGGIGLAVLKALLASALAAVLLMIRRPGESLWIPALCTGFAVLSLSPRLFMQPAVLSFFFLALTLWVLTRRKAPTGKAAEGSSLLARFASWPYRLYTLPVLFALWVNVDTWFVLGPITVALYWLGETLQDAIAPAPNGPDTPEPGERRRLLLVLLIGLAACLLNPFHVYAFQVPGELSPLIVTEIREDSAFRNMFLSPWSENVLVWNLLHSVAATAYYPLLFLSAASFIFNFAGWRWWRALVWAAFAALGAYHARSIPFFAVVAGPIMALNFQDMMLRRQAEQRAVLLVPTFWSTAGRVLSVVVLVIAVAAAWPGWLYGFPGEGNAEARRVGWGMSFDPALVETAEHLAQWRRQGTIAGDNNAFNFHPDAAYYLAFYCPEERTFFDYRFPLFKDTASTYLQLRADLNPGSGMEGLRPQTAPARGSTAEWQRVFRERHITHVVVYDPDVQNALPIRMLPAIQRMEDDKSQPEAQRQWTLIYLRGRVALYAWSDPMRGRDATVRAMELKPDEQAFGPAAKTAPGARAGDGPGARDSIWTKYIMPASARTPDSYEAWFHSFVGQIETEQALRAAGGDYARQMAAVIAFGAGLRLAPEKLVNRIVVEGSVLSGTGGRFHSPASTLLSIRAARRALAENPDDDTAYWQLGSAYQRLPENQSPRDLYYNPRSIIGGIRRCQIAGSLFNSLKIRPNNAEVHKQLAEVYLYQNFYDLALIHRKEYLRLSEETGRHPGEAEGEYRDRLSQLRDENKRLEDQVKQRQNQFLTETQGFTTQVLSKVQMALNRDLCGQALDLLLTADPDVELGPKGRLIELELLLRIGRVEEWPADLRELETDNAFNMLIAVRAATVGDYDQADEILGKIIVLTRQRHVAPLPFVVCPGICTAWVGMLDATGTNSLLWHVSQRLLNRLSLQDLRSISLVSVEEGELTILRGLLALEAGRNKAALEHFRHALTLSLPPTRYCPYFAVLGTNSPLEAAVAFAANAELSFRPYLMLPSQQWAVEYTKLLEQNAK